MQIEHRTFTSLVMSATSGMSRECRKFYTLLSEIMSEKRDISYSTIATWIRKTRTFSLMKPVGFCTRGSRSTFSSTRLKKLIDEDANASERTFRIA